MYRIREKLPPLKKSHPREIYACDEGLLVAPRLLSDERNVCMLLVFY